MASATDPTAALYSAMTKAENRLGGGEGLEGVYGSITRTGTAKVLDALKEHAGLDDQSVVLDVGSGLGRPLLHALLHSRVSATYGIEVDAVKCQKAAPFVGSVVKDLEALGGVHRFHPEALPKFICAPIERIPSIEPATHIYAAWEGFGPDAKESVGRLFSQSSTARAIAIVQRSFRGRDPAHEMSELGFGDVTMVANVAVKMAGSGRQLQAYCFVKTTESQRQQTTTQTQKQQQDDLTTLPAFQPPPENQTRRTRE